jgi:hypothetical protein
VVNGEKIENVIMRRKNVNIMKSGRKLKRRMKLDLILKKKKKINGKELNYKMIKRCKKKMKYWVGWKIMEVI